MILTDVVDNLVVPEPKVTRYLLNLDHERGGPKARFFLGFGFGINDPDVLVRALMTHGAAYEIVETEDRFRATVYTVEGEIESPDGRNPRIRTVWQIDEGATEARFITAVPMRRGRSNR